MSYDMLCRKSEQYLCLETRKKTRKEKTHTHTHTFNEYVCRMQGYIQDALKESAQCTGQAQS